MSDFFDDFGVSEGVSSSSTEFVDLYSDDEDEGKIRIIPTVILFILSLISTILVSVFMITFSKDKPLENEIFLFIPMIISIIIQPIIAIFVSSNKYCKKYTVITLIINILFGAIIISSTTFGKLIIINIHLVLSIVILLKNGFFKYKPYLFLKIFTLIYIDIIAIFKLPTTETYNIYSVLIISSFTLVLAITDLLFSIDLAEVHFKMKQEFESTKNIQINEVDNVIVDDKKDNEQKSNEIETDDFW